ncbi:hypothetical protein BGZ65_005403 [Modicella reniformis]|uniref:Uncharacterized protein n=1 Tax=Modicella reniformis TaxID=1440133 RepID=A0A9P6IXC0_9FUNG|nr:hypothetical protein BGZ65_005403 [Modicella reniformis]
MFLNLIVYDTRHRRRPHRNDNDSQGEDVVEILNGINEDLQVDSPFLLVNEADEGPSNIVETHEEYSTLTTTSKISSAFLNRPWRLFQQKLQQEKKQQGILGLESKLPPLSRSTINEYFEYLRPSSSTLSASQSIRDRILGFYRQPWYRLAKTLGYVLVGIHEYLHKREVSSSRLRSRSKYCSECRIFMDKDVVGSENMAWILDSHLRCQARPAKIPMSSLATYITLADSDFLCSLSRYQSFNLCVVLMLMVEWKSILSVLLARNLMMLHDRESDTGIDLPGAVTDDDVSAVNSYHQYLLAHLVTTTDRQTVYT